MLEQANEVQEALGRSYGMPEVDEDELEAGTLLSFILINWRLYIESVITSARIN